MAFSPDGQYLATAVCEKIDPNYYSCLQGRIVLLNVASQQTYDLPMTGHPPISIAISPDGKTLASGTENAGTKGGTIVLWDTVNRNMIGQPLVGNYGSVKAVAFSPDGQTLASGSCGKYNQSGFCSEGKIILWNVSDPTLPTPLDPLAGQGDYVNGVAFSPDGKTLASGSEDKTILLWDVASHEPIGLPFIGHNDYVYSVAFSPDGKTLASGSSDRTVILWDVATHQPIGQPLKGHSDPVVRVTFSPDGQTLASGSWDHKIILWEIDPQIWMEKICQRVGRNLTQAEWAQFFPDEAYRLTCPEWPAGK
jgi:WD40 repeat protein